MWLNSNECRDALYGAAKVADQWHASCRWDSIELEIETIDYLSHFEVFLPKCDGSLAPKEMEAKCISCSYDWFMYMTTHEQNRAVFEASVLIVAAITLLEEKVTSIIGSSAFGYPLETLLNEVSRGLHPRASARLRDLITKAIESQNHRQTGNLDFQLSTLKRISSCYLEYMRWRNIDGYYEIALLCSFATMGAILAHDTHSILRHFEEDEMANCHRYLDPNLQRSIERAFKRVAALRNRLRFDPTIPHGIKRCAMVAISSCHAFNYACHRYRFGADFAAAAFFVTNSKTFVNPFRGEFVSTYSYKELSTSIKPSIPPSAANV
ncbi:hypothetical protein L0F63_002547 [Massospora cicadina]|nr:hypothetical protein L0F63_002547 [Massospora cicadina]